jgi:hypothetical protein
MELYIPNPDSNDYCEAVDIPFERQQELSAALDEMVRKANSGPLRMVKMHDIFKGIASFCSRPEELIYCTVLHCGWQARMGRILAPGPLNYAKINLGIAELYDRLRKDLHSNPSTRGIMEKLIFRPEEEVRKEGAREGVHRLLDYGEAELARDIINKLTGWAF